jgi:hypothetical protein
MIEQELKLVQIYALKGIQLDVTLGLTTAEFQAMGGSESLAADVVNFAQLPDEAFVSVVQVMDLGKTPQNGRQGLLQSLTVIPSHSRRVQKRTPSRSWKS